MPKLNISVAGDKISSSSIAYSGAKKSKSGIKSSQDSIKFVEHFHLAGSLASLMLDNAKSNPNIFQAPASFKIILSGFKLWCMSFTLSCKNDRPSQS